MPSRSKRSTATTSNTSKPISNTEDSKKAASKPVSRNTTGKSSEMPLVESSTDTVSGAPPHREQSSQTSETQQSGTVNRKKQKRRQKQAARLAAEQQRNHPHDPASQQGNRNVGAVHNHHHDDVYSDHLPNRKIGKDGSNENHNSWHSNNGWQSPQYHPEAGQHYDMGKQKGKKKKGKKAPSPGQEEIPTSLSTPPPPIGRLVGPPPQLVNSYRSAHRISRDRIWNTSTHEERENIKEFWLQLGEDERRSLVKVEKEAVLRKMKEQQKHSCSCTVCGRKRTAIEEELEVLYDAYYEELEQYANNNQNSFNNGSTLRLPPRLYQSPMRSFDHHHRLPGSQHPPPGRVHEIPDEEDDEDDLDEDYDDDEDDDGPYSDDELDNATRTTRADFFAFGNSLTVKDGILTVADDLLKNDGKHFIDMMEQLAERRMQREIETQYVGGPGGHQSVQPSHNHEPPLEEDDYDEDEEDDYDSQDDDEFEEDEMDTMTEEQRMEEGRRMFQIFAARMFEQRVLTAYREKVARERQQRLIEELEEESRLDEEREAKKAKEAQKKKDKKKQQKQAKEEERARKEAERAAEEAAQKAAEEKKLREQQQRKEEQRKKREAEKKALEEQRQRKEAERQKKLKEERERQAEVERKQREQKEREKRKREELKKKEREERELKEKELQEKKESKEREAKAREQRERDEKAAAKAEREHREQDIREENLQQPLQNLSLQGGKRPSQPGLSHFPPGLHAQTPIALQSPHFQVATPVVPKAPTPVRPRQSSQQGSHGSSPRSQPAYTDNSMNSVSPGATATSQSSSNLSSMSNKNAMQQPILHQLQPPTSVSSPVGITRGAQAPPGFTNGLNINGIPPNMGLAGIGPRPPLGHENQMYSAQTTPMSNQFRGIGSQEGISLPPGISAPRPIHGRGFGTELNHAGLPFHSSFASPNPLTPHVAQSSRDTLPHAHSGQSSFERSPLDFIQQNLPISRPAPIQRPSSTVPHDQGKNGTKGAHADIDELSTQLGSSALLDDTDVPLSSGPSKPIPTGVTPGPLAGPPGAGRIGFGTSSIFSDTLGSPKTSNFSLDSQSAGGTWGTGIPFGPPGFPPATSWGSNSGWSNNAFGVIGGSHRLHTSRPVMIRLLVTQSCKQLSATSPSDHSGFHNVNQVLRHIDQMNPPLDVPVSLEEMIDICDTEGNSQNGGGTLTVKSDGPNGPFVKFEPDTNSVSSGMKGSIAPGDIGGPISGNSYTAPVGGGLMAPGSRHHFPSVNPNMSTGF